LVLNQREENIGGESLDLEVQLLGHLALLERLVNPADMLPES